MASKTTLTGWTEIEAFAAVRISVKGTVTDAQRALIAHGVRAVLVERGEHATFWDVAEGARPALVRWFCEPAVCGDGGFPAGTLLFHG